MKHFCHILFSFPLLWQVCRCVTEVRFMTGTVINASKVDGRETSFGSFHVTPSTQPFIFVQSTPGHQQWRPGAVEKMYKRALPMRSAFMSSRSTLQSTDVSRLATLSLTIGVVLTLGIFLYWANPSTDETTAIEAEKSNGIWALAYREAEGTRRDAIDMLLRCNIVSVQEFGSESADRERIENYIWVAVNMLMDQSVNDWVDSPDRARRAFDKGFKASFPGLYKDYEQSRQAAAFKSFLGTPAGENPQQRPVPGAMPKQSGLHHMPPLTMPVTATPWQGRQGSPPPTAGSVLSSVDDTEYTDLNSSAISSDQSLSPRASLRYFENPLPSEENLSTPSRTLPLHLLGPTPSIFRHSGRSKESGSGRSAGDGSHRRGRAKAAPPDGSKFESIQEDKSQQGSFVVPVLDCSPRRPDIDTDLPQGVVQMQSPDGNMELLTATPVGSTLDVPDFQCPGEPNPAG